MKSIEITVTPEDIATGMRRSPEYCPVAQALLKKRPDLLGVRVNRKSAELIAESGKELYDLPQEAQDFIDAFDDSRTPKSVFQTMHKADRTFRLFQMAHPYERQQSEE